MKHFFSALLIVFVAPPILFACSNKVSSQQSDTAEAIDQAMQDKLTARYDSVFDVHGPVRSVTFSVTSNPNYWQFEYIVSKLEYLPRGNKWNIKGNQHYKLNYFTEDENRNFVCDFIDEDELNVSIVYSYNPKTLRYDERTIQVAPEYDGCDLLYIYDEKDSIVSAEFTDFSWNSDKNDFNKKKSILKVKDEGIDDYGNWTQRTLYDNNINIIIKRTINYYSPEEIPVDCDVFEGDSIKVNETVGDFNGDGVLEKAWVNLADLGDDDPRFIEPVEIKLSFSDPHISTVSLGHEVGFKLYNLGDINGDGCDDIGMIRYPDPFAYKYFKVWVSDKGKNWHKILECTIWPESLLDEFGDNFVPVMRTENGLIEYYSADMDNLDDPTTHHLYQYKDK